MENYTFENDTINFFHKTIISILKNGSFMEENLINGYINDYITIFECFSDIKHYSFVLEKKYNILLTYNYDEMKDIYEEVLRFYVICSSFVIPYENIISEENWNAQIIYEEELKVLKFIIKMLDGILMEKHKQYILQQQKEKEYMEYRHYTTIGHFEEEQKNYQEFLDEKSIFSEEDVNEQANIEQHDLEKMEHGRKKDKERRNSKKSKKEQLRFGEKKYEKGLPKLRHISRHQKKQSLISFEF